MNSARKGRAGEDRAPRAAATLAPVTIAAAVIPAGYSFNLDGTSIYLSMAAVFVTRVFKVDLSLGQQLAMLGVLMVTSTGAAGRA